MIRILFAALLAASFAAATFTEVSARTNDNPNSGVCKSGKKAANIKNCKENGGKR